MCVCVCVCVCLCFSLSLSLSLVHFEKNHAYNFWPLGFSFLGLDGTTSYKELVKTLLKQKQKSAWRLKYNGYDPQKSQINALDRRTQTTIFCVSVSHCGLRKHLKRLCLTDSAHCECGSEEKLLSTFFKLAHTWRQYGQVLARRY